MHTIKNSRKLAYVYKRRFYQIVESNRIEYTVIIFPNRNALSTTATFRAFRMLTISRTTKRRECPYVFLFPFRL